MSYRVSFSDAIGIVGIILTVVFLVLDKAGKLKGGWLLGLLLVAGAMTLFIAIGNPWVLDAPPRWKIWRGALMFSVVALTYSGASIWVASGPATSSEQQASNSAVPVQHAGSPTPETVASDTQLVPQTHATSKPEQPQIRRPNIRPGPAKNAPQAVVSGNGVAIGSVNQAPRSMSQVVGGAGNGAVSGDLNNAPCGIQQVGGNNNQAITNCAPPSHWFDLNGTERSHVGFEARTILGRQFDAYQEMTKLESENEWTALRDAAEKQIALTPDWPTPYFVVSVAYVRLCEKELAINGLQMFIDKATRLSTSTKTYDSVLQQANTNIAILRSGRWPFKCD